jgi:hypothetical protein
MLNIAIINILWYLEEAMWNLVTEYDDTEAGNLLHESCQVRDVNVGYFRTDGDYYATAPYKSR